MCDSRGPDLCKDRALEDLQACVATALKDNSTLTSLSLQAIKGLDDKDRAQFRGLRDGLTVTF